ncbi:MAG: S8 family serine peptidase [Halobacteriovoraceae bacterium]|nr:S8 family serine peptidase [Halobacteriovoraceae bacterium]MCB9095640.1 S8 family serine peptidase [Halobacteriovoraceae bacterium]
MKRILATVLIYLFAVQSVFSVTFTENQVKELMKSPYVSWGITQNLNTQNENPSINLTKALKIYEEKKAVTVAVVDTGIDFNHKFIKDNIYVKGKKGTLSNFGLDYSQAHKGIITTQPFDHHGHGTHVAGIIKAINPNVRILPIKYFSEKATGEQNLVNSIKALEYAVNQEVDIINYSGGGPEADMANKIKEKSIIKKARDKGIIVVAAAGNNGSNIDTKENMYYPASYNFDNIIAVSAHDTNLQLISSSNYGVSTVHVAAPGFKINSSTPVDSSRMSGTSQATAFVSGLVSLIKGAHPSFDYQEIKKIVISSSHERKQFKGKILGGQVDAYNALVVADTLEKSKQTPAEAQRKVARRN